MTFFGRPEPAPLVLRELGRAIPLGGDARIVVLGCGSGVDAFAIARLARGEVIGVDASGPSIAEANTARDLVRASGARLEARLSFERASVFSWLRDQPGDSVAVLIDTVGFHNFVAEGIRDGSPRVVTRAETLVRQYRRVLREHGSWILTVRHTHQRKNGGRMPGCECVANAAAFAEARFRFTVARPVKLPEYRDAYCERERVRMFPAYQTVARPR